LADIHKALFERAVAFRQANTYYPTTYDEFCQAVENGFAWAWWCGDPADEERVKADTKATTRCIPLDQPGGSGPCIVCGKPASEMAVWARAY
jgi:prolyl-tRNA synthetase